MQSMFRQFSYGVVFALALPFLLCGCLAGYLAAAFRSGFRQGWSDWQKDDAPNAQVRRDSAAPERTP